MHELVIVKFKSLPPSSDLIFAKFNNIEMRVTVSTKTFSYQGGELQINIDIREIVIISRPMFGSDKTTKIPFSDFYDCTREYGVLDSPERGGGSLLIIVTKSQRTFKLSFGTGDECRRCSNELWNIHS